MTQESLTRSVRLSWSLAAQAVQISLQLRGSLSGMIGEATRALSRPESAISAATACRVSLIHPIPLRLAEALLEVGPARFAGLGQQVLIYPIEIRIVLYDRAIETGALVDGRG